MLNIYLQYEKHHRVLLINILEYCQWSSWTKGTCTRTCGGGRRVKNRTLLYTDGFQGSCNGQSLSSESCNNNQCPGEITSTSKWFDSNAKKYFYVLFVYIDVSMISYLTNFTSAPELRGVRYKLSAAINNGTVWVDRNYKFSNMPAYLEGTLLFQVPHKAIRQGTIIEFLSHQPSTIYLAHEGVRNGGFKTSLPKYGWKLVTNHAQLRTGCCNLRYIWKKVVTNDDLTTISLPATTTSETVHCIFVQSMYTRIWISKLIFT